LPHYRRIGDIPRKRHTLHHHDGAVACEELMGAEGFSGASSLLYHRHSPSAIVRIEACDSRPVCWRENEPLRPHHLRPNELSRGSGRDPISGRQPLLGNRDVEIAWITADTSGPLYRDATGDELVYVQDGEAVLETAFGRLPVSQGDYVVIPCSTTHRWSLTSPVEMYAISARGRVTVPSRYLNDQRAPEPEPLLVEGEEVPVLVRTRNGLSMHVHATHPFDVVGWDGYLYPWAMSIHDFESIVGRIHQPPPVHQTFAGPNFVVCSFVPRLYDFDPDAVKVPYHHANVDSDEVLMYAGGNFMSRAGSGIGTGSISLHPPGFVHGPQPGSREVSAHATRTEELAVMVDTFDRLALSAEALAVSDPSYPFTWSS
jgi:homogentisate 1,2-dioxygenase